MGILDRFRQSKTSSSPSSPDQAIAMHRAEGARAAELPAGAPAPGLYITEDDVVINVSYPSGLAGSKIVAVLEHRPCRSSLMRHEQDLLDRRELPILSDDAFARAEIEVHHVGMPAPRTLGIDVDSGAYVAKGPDFWKDGVHYPAIDWSPVKELTIAEERQLAAGTVELEPVDMFTFSQPKYITAAAAARVASPLQGDPSKPTPKAARPPKADAPSRKGPGRSL